MDRQGVVVSANPAALRILNLLGAHPKSDQDALEAVGGLTSAKSAKQELVGRSLAEFVSERPLADWQRSWRPFFRSLGLKGQLMQLQPFEHELLLDQQQPESQVSDDGAPARMFEADWVRLPIQPVFAELRVYDLERLVGQSSPTQHQQQQKPGRRRRRPDLALLDPQKLWPGLLGPAIEGEQVGAAVQGGADEFAELEDRCVLVCMRDLSAVWGRLVQIQQLGRNAAHTVLEATDDVSIVYDWEGRLVYANSALRALLGWDPEQLRTEIADGDSAALVSGLPKPGSSILQTTSKGVAKLLAQRSLAPVSSLFGEPGRPPQQIQLRRSDGREISVLAFVTATRLELLPPDWQSEGGHRRKEQEEKSDDQDPPVYHAVFLDLTPLHDLNVELQRLNQELIAVTGQLHL